MSGGEPTARPLGGNSAGAMLRDGVVLRPPGPSTELATAVLRHLERRGFAKAPRPLGLAADGFERQSLLPGKAYDYPFPDVVWSRAALTGAAELLAELHDALRGFVPPAGARTLLPPAPRGTHELMCHNDVAPYNMLFEDGRPVAIVDFDTVGRGPRLWDVVHAAYRFVPLSIHEGPSLSDHEREERLHIFADVYGLDAGERRAFRDLLLRRLQALEDYITHRAAAGDPVATRHLAAGDRELYAADRRRIAATPAFDLA